MRYWTLLLTLSLAFASCQQAVNEIPEDLDGKRQFLKTKKAELRELTKVVQQIEAEIAELDPASQEEKRRLVTTVPVTRKDFEHFVEIQGAVEAEDYVDATSEIAGRILQLKVDEGDAVRKGQLIAKLDLEQLKKQKAEIEKSLELAKQVFERQSRLWDQNIGSEVQFLQAKNNKERLEKSIETLDFQLEKSEVFAPASGVIERVVLQSGELAAPGMPIVQILNTAQLKAVVDVPENYLKAVTPGEKVKISFPAIDQEQDARVSLIGRTIDPSNRTFKVEARISSSSRLIKPNLLAIMYIKDFEVKDAVAIPLETVQQEVSGKSFVFIKETGANGDFAKKVYVEIGEAYQGEIIVKEGLSGNETLILEGGRGVAENELIEVKNPKNVASNG